MHIARSLGIDGWMKSSEIAWLAQAASQHSSIVEIGSYLGRSTVALALNTPGVVYALDDWSGPRDIEHDNASLYKRFCENVGDLILAAKVIPVVCNHRELTAWPSPPDMVFIDGSHEYEDVRQDVAFWKEHLAPGGLICGHDIQFKGVRQAVTEAFPTVWCAAGTTIWFIK